MAKARETQIENQLREVKLFARRAAEPEDRAALAELERELMQMRERWRSAGLLPFVRQPELETAVA